MRLLKITAICVALLALSIATLWSIAECRRWKTTVWWSAEELSVGESHLAVGRNIAPGHGAPSSLPIDYGFWCPDRQLLKLGWHREGPWVAAYHAGPKAFVGSFKNAEREGVFVYWNEDGSISSESGLYASDEKVGPVSDDDLRWAEAEFASLREKHSNKLDVALERERRQRK